ASVVRIVADVYKIDAGLLDTDPNFTPLLNAHFQSVHIPLNEESFISISLYDVRLHYSNQEVANLLSVLVLPTVAKVRLICEKHNVKFTVSCDSHRVN